MIGVLDTIMPDGSSGFSFLLIITFTLPPIQLGFGFTLNGVGGLGGVNRTMNTDALQADFARTRWARSCFRPIRLTTLRRSSATFGIFSRSRRDGISSARCWSWDGARPR